MAQVKPQVIDDEQHEQVYERVAAVDVAKDSGMVCTRMPHPSRPGARQSTVWTVKARMTAIGALGRQLKRDGIQMVTLESTLVICGSNKIPSYLAGQGRRVRVRDGRPGGHLIARGPGRVLPRAAAAGGGFLRGLVRGPGAGRWFPRGGGV